MRSTTYLILASIWFSLFVFVGNAYLAAQQTTDQVHRAAVAGNHSLSNLQVGEILVGEFRCGACHSSIARDVRFDQDAPDLSNVGSRVQSDYLLRFLSSPGDAEPHSKMPDLLTNKTNDEKQKIALALTHFLSSKTDAKDSQVVEDSFDREKGKELYHSIGCVACHGPREKQDLDQVEEADSSFSDVPQRKETQKQFEPIAVSLEHVAKKYSLESLAEFLHQPLRVRKSGRMPDLKLNRAEAMSLSAYLVGNQTVSGQQFVPQDSWVQEGQKYFEELKCSVCHQMEGTPTVERNIPIYIANLDSGCLSKSIGKRRDAPSFAITESQSLAMVESLRQRPVREESHEAVIAKTMVAWKCIACHMRNQDGGIHPSYNAYFISSEKNLGDDGRIPPPLTLVGAKLQSTWLSKVLFDGESIRPYMTTRMPLFGVDNLEHLPRLLESEDVYEGEGIEIPPTETQNQDLRDKAKQFRTAGRELLGDKGLQCIVCHNFNGKPATTNKGMDLVSSYERLKPNWFNGFMRNPNKFRPRIVMPNSWPDGVAVHKGILDGNTEAQIQAIWFYLSLGTSAADPPGIKPINTKLRVDDLAMIHRGRSRIAGFRGIAVGLPNKISYAWNAETGTLSAIWTGDFIQVNWNGQGAGDFTPSNTPIQLPQDISLAVLDDATSVWPRMPIMTKEAKRNPNPLYPKNLGYQFHGFELDESGIPTFLYRFGAVEIRDRSHAPTSSQAPSLRRVISFRSQANAETTPESIWFRVMAGNIQRESENAFRTEKLRVRISNPHALLRHDPIDANQTELILRLEFAKGTTELELLYEPME